MLQLAAFARKYIPGFEAKTWSRSTRTSKTLDSKGGTHWTGKREALRMRRRAS
jgi:hypothetical protein